MFNELWRRWFGKPENDPRFDSWVRQHHCEQLLVDPEFIQYDPYHAALAKKRLDEYNESYLTFVSRIDLATFQRFSPEEQKERNKIELVIYEVYDYMEIIEAAKDKQKKFE